MEQNKETLKTYFETGDFPTENQFADLIDSYVDSKQPEGDSNRRFVVNADGSVSLAPELGTTLQSEDIIVGGRNLIIRKNLIPNKFVSYENGNVFNTPDHYLQEISSIESDTEYVMSIDHFEETEFSGYIHIAFYDLSSQYITGIYNSLADAPGHGDVIRFKTPTNATQYRISGFKINNSKFQLEKGTYSTQWNLAPEDLELTKEGVENLGIDYESLSNKPVIGSGLTDVYSYSGIGYPYKTQERIGGKAFYSGQSRYKIIRAPLNFSCSQELTFKITNVNNNSTGRFSEITLSFYRFGSSSNYGFYGSSVYTNNGFQLTAVQIAIHQPTGQITIILDRQYQGNLVIVEFVKAVTSAFSSSNIQSNLKGNVVFTEASTIPSEYTNISNATLI